MQRLAFIRYSYLVAAEQSEQPEPMSALSLLGLHDCVELFLQLAAEYLNVGDSKKTDFIQYWGFIDSRLEPERLSHKPAMRRLNDARVSLKHHGNLPSYAQIEEFRVITSNFLEESTPLVFGITFDQISMIDLVQYEEPRDTLKAALSVLNDGNTETAMSNIAIALEQILYGINQGYFNRYARSPYFLPADFTFESSFFRRGSAWPADPDRERFEDKLTNAVTAMQPAVRALSLGLDYRKYAKFSLLTPVARRNLGGTYDVQVMQGLEGSIDWPPTVEACRFCMDFVIESAIRMRGIDVSSVLALGNTDKFPS